MLKCSRCGKYYIPGYLDCECRMTARLPSAPAAPQLAFKEQRLLSAPNITPARTVADTSKRSDNREVRLA